MIVTHPASVTEIRYCFDVYYSTSEELYNTYSWLNISIKMVCRKQT